MKRYLMQRDLTPSKMPVSAVPEVECASKLPLGIHKADATLWQEPVGLHNLYPGHASQGSLADCEEEASCKVPATTTLVGCMEFISQATFLKTICAPGASEKEMSELFVFRKPRQRFERLNASSILKLSSKQHDVLYALSGCSDVMSVMSRITDEVRQAVDDVYGIDKNNLRTWFKNRGGALRLCTKQGDANAKGRRLNGTVDNNPSKYARHADLDAVSGSAAAFAAPASLPQSSAQPGTSTSSDQSNHAVDVGLPQNCHSSPTSHAELVKDFASTRLLGSPDVISQDIFLSVIQKPGAADRELTELFEFRRPRQSYKRANASTLLNLNSKQHDVLYALCGCSDVVSVASLVKQEVRDTVCEVYSIDKASLAIWFKNRRQIVRKPAGKAPATGGRNSCHGPLMNASATAGAVPSEDSDLRHASAPGRKASVPLHGTVPEVPSSGLADAWKVSTGTKLLGGTDVISQAIFALIIKSPGVAQQELSELFVFNRLPVSKGGVHADLTTKQHDVLSALAGCADVMCSVSKVNAQVLSSVFDVYGINNMALRCWFRSLDGSQQQQQQQRPTDLGQSASHVLPTIKSFPRTLSEMQSLLAAEQAAAAPVSAASSSFSLPCMSLGSMPRLVLMPRAYDNGAAAELYPAMQLEQVQQRGIWTASSGYTTAASGQQKVGLYPAAISGQGDRIIYNMAQVQAMEDSNGNVALQREPFYVKAPISMESLLTSMLQGQQREAANARGRLAPGLILARQIS